MAATILRTTTIEMTFRLTAHGHTTRVEEEVTFQSPYPIAGRLLRAAARYRRPF